VLHELRRYLLFAEDRIVVSQRYTTHDATRFRICLSIYLSMPKISYLIYLSYQHTRGAFLPPRLFLRETEYRQ